MKLLKLIFSAIFRPRVNKPKTRSLMKPGAKAEPVMAALLQGKRTPRAEQLYMERQSDEDR